MQVCRIRIQNFRGIRKADLLLPKHAVLIGDNNTGKTTILEALDLVLGPERLTKSSCIDEHDFFEGKYTTTSKEDRVPTTYDGEGESGPELQDDLDLHNESAPQIEIEVTITDLSDVQRTSFGDYAEWWDLGRSQIIEGANLERVDAVGVSQAIRVTFIGRYVDKEDDFEGNTYFTRSIEENETPERFGRRQKQICGFLYLRSIRTGSRALSLERGSLLDIILRLKEIRPKMWEDTLANLEQFTVASNPDLGISGVLESINEALKKYVPKEWGVHPRLKVSNLTREHLRKIITAFVATGEGDHAAPFYRQGAGTINLLVLAMLTQIAEDKQNVIFAMEEPETAVPPYAQKRIVHEIRSLSAQSIFTSHSPYVLEEFNLSETVVLFRRADGELIATEIELPESLKAKRYRQEFRTRFGEGLLARRILLAEGSTEAIALPAVARRLAELNPEQYSSLEALGVCTIDAGSDSKIAELGQFYQNLGKRVFAICDNQSEENKSLIEAMVECLFMHTESGFEDLVLNNTPEAALERFCDIASWPQHLRTEYPNPKANPVQALRKYFIWAKGQGAIADYLVQCSENEIPQWIKDTCTSLKELYQSSYEPTVPSADDVESSGVAANGC